MFVSNKVHDRHLPIQSDRTHLPPDLEQVINNMIVVWTSSMRLQLSLFRRHAISFPICLTIQFETTQNIWKIAFPERIHPISVQHL